MKIDNIILNQNLSSLIKQLQDQVKINLLKNSIRFFRLIVQIEKVTRVSQISEQSMQNRYAYLDLLKSVQKASCDLQIVLPSIITKLITRRLNQMPHPPSQLSYPALPQSPHTLLAQKNSLHTPKISTSSAPMSNFLKINYNQNFNQSESKFSFLRSSNSNHLLGFIQELWSRGQGVGIWTGSNYNIVSVDCNRNLFQEKVKKAACGLLNANGGYLLLTYSKGKSDLQSQQKFISCQEILKNFIFPAYFRCQQKKVNKKSLNQNQFLVGYVCLSPQPLATLYFAKIKNGYHYYLLDENAQNHQNILTLKQPQKMYTIMHNHHLDPSAFQSCSLQKQPQIQSQLSLKYREQILLIFSSSSDDYNVEQCKRRFQEIGMKSIDFSKPYTQFRNKSNKSIWVISHDYTLDRISYEVEGAVSNKKKLIALVTCKRYIIAYSVPTQVYLEYQKVFSQIFGITLKPYTKGKTVHKEKYKDKQKDKEMKNYYIQFKQIKQAIFSTLYLDNQRIKCIFINKTKFQDEISH